MNETARTAVFMIAGLIGLAIAFFVQPAAPERDAFDDTGERFFGVFAPTDARGIEILTFDESTASVQTFQIASTPDDAWVIASHEDYPADAEEHLANAAASVLDLVKGPRVSDRAADHALYGVVDPKDAEATAGVGTRVTMTDAAGEPLVDLIIGKPVKDAAGIRYVRIPDRDRVYTAKVDTSSLTTRFQDWIEEDLLQLTATEIRKIIINDYSIDEINGRIVQGDLVEMTREDGSAEWMLAGLGPDETLDTEVVDAMTRALDDLEIIDVHRKPAGLSAELKTQDDMQLDRQAISSLSARGFYIANGALVSNQGETIAHVGDGVIYVLRFGEIALGDRAGATLGDDEGEATPATASGTARYLFVMAEFAEDEIPAPEYETVPDLPELAEAGEGGETGENLRAERDRIVQTNEQKRQVYESSLEAGRHRVSELNERFADWYYVIPNDVYEKVRLTRGDLIAAPEAPDAP